MKENSWHKIGCPDNLIFLLMMFGLVTQTPQKRAVSKFTSAFSFLSFVG